MFLESMLRLDADVLPSYLQLQKINGDLTFQMTVFTCLPIWL